MAPSGLKAIVGESKSATLLHFWTFYAFRCEEKSTIASSESASVICCWFRVLQLVLISPTTLLVLSNVPRSFKATINVLIMIFIS